MFINILSSSAHYGLYTMTFHGADVSFPLGKLRYSAPELIMQGSWSNKTHMQERVL